MRWLLALLVSLAMAGMAAPAVGNQVVISLEIRDARYEQPRFDSPPRIRYEIRKDGFYNFEDPPLLKSLPTFTKQPNGFKFERWPVAWQHASNRFAHFVIVNMETFEYVPVNPFRLRLELTPELVNSGQPIEHDLNLDHRRTIALSYKRQVHEITRSINPTSKQVASAYSAASTALQLDPTLDNFLLMANVLKFALRAKEFSRRIPLNFAQLRALPGFGDLTFDKQWLVQTEFLDVLTASPDLTYRINPTLTVLDAAINLGSEMIEQVDFENPQHTKLRITRVYQSLSYLHSKNEDCLALSENNSQAITRADAIEMNWSSQRVLMLDWADCLERMTRFGVGRSLEEVASEISTNLTLVREWQKFLAAGKNIEGSLRVATGSTSQRIKQLLEFAQSLEGS